MAFLSELPPPPPSGIPQWELVLSPGLIERRRTTLHGGVVRGGVAAHVIDGRCRERARDRCRRAQPRVLVRRQEEVATETAICFSGLLVATYARTC